MKPQYFIRLESGLGRQVWYGPYEVMPKRKLKSLLKADPNEVYDYTVYQCKVVPVDWDKLCG